MHNTSNILETDKKLWEYFNDEKMNITETVPTDHGFVVGVYSALFVVGAAGNVSVFVSLVRSRRRKSRVNLLMTHLAVADMIVTFIVIPFEIGWRTTNAWLAGNWACKFLLVLRAFGLYLSSNVLVCISLDRYFAVLHPLRLAVARNRSKTMLWFAWLVALISSLPQIPHAASLEWLPATSSLFDNYKNPPKDSTLLSQESLVSNVIYLDQYWKQLHTADKIAFPILPLYVSLVFRVMHHPTVPEFQQCVSFEAFSNPHQELAYNVTCLFAMYFLPLIIITVCYICIFSEIHTNSKEVTDKSLPTDTGRIQLRRSDQRPLARARRRTLRMTVTIVSVFACCWLPYATMTLWYMFDRESAIHVSDRLQDLFFIMAVSNSCMDPLVYGSYTLNMNMINRSLRKVFCVHDNVPKANATLSGPDNYGCKVTTKEIVHPGNQYAHRRQYTVAFQETSLIPSANTDPVPIWIDNNIQSGKKDDVIQIDRF